MALYAWVGGGFTVWACLQLIMSEFYLGWFMTHARKETMPDVASKE
jgi:hypothetical protein